MKAGEIAIAKIPQADGKYRNRPVLLLKQMPPYNDWLVCGISSQVRQYVENFDELILTKDKDFKQSSLLSDSVIRLGFLTVLPENVIPGTIGNISSGRYKRLLKTLAHHLLK